MADTPTVDSPVIIDIDHPVLGAFTWEPGAHAQQHLADLPEEERERVVADLTAAIIGHAAGMSLVICGFQVQLMVIEGDLDRFQGPGPSFWDPPIPPKRRRSWLKDLFGEW